jgi:lysozyme
MSRKRVAAAFLTLSMAGFATWQASEGFTDHAVIPTRGDVPTIGHGSTRYEDGTPVKLGDRITRERAVILARNLHKQEERRFIATIPDVPLHQEEFDLYMDFVGQFGIGNWRSSTMRQRLVQGDFVGACNALLKWKRQDGRDCSKPENWGPRGCKGVWTRQLERHRKCLEAQ